MCQWKRVLQHKNSRFLCTGTVTSAWYLLHYSPALADVFGSRFWIPHSFWTRHRLYVHQFLFYHARANHSSMHVKSHYQEPADICAMSLMHQDLFMLYSPWHTCLDMGIYVGLKTEHIKVSEHYCCTDCTVVKVSLLWLCCPLQFLPEQISGGWCKEGGDIGVCLCFQPRGH